MSDSATDLGTFLAYAADVGASSLGVVPGTVTAVSPLTVTVAGSTTAAAGVSRLGTYNPRVGDVVEILRIGPTLLVLGQIASAATTARGLVLSQVADLTIQGSSSPSSFVDKTIFNVTAPAAGWVEVTVGAMYYGFSGGNITSARGGLYSNSAGGPDGGAVQAYTALGGAVAVGNWARLDFSSMTLIFPIAAGASTGVIFRGSWTASPAANCWFGGYASCKLYAT